MIRDELKALIKNKLLVFVLLVIALIPAIYAGIFLSSMWDPYGDVEYLPVAVVNNDQPYRYEGKKLDIGNSLADELADSDAMSFNVVDADVAKQGLVNGTYYMVITIPKDFSRNASTLMDKNPKKMMLDYETNPGTNYVASKLSNTAVKEIKENIVEEVTRTYAENLFDKVQEIGDGFDDAVDGTGKLIDGQNKLIAGNKTISKNLDKLAKSTITFRDGANTLEEGVKTYTQGVHKASKGTDKLDKYGKKISKGIGRLSSGMPQLKAGTSQILGGLKQMSGELSEGLSEENVAQINQGISGMKPLNEGIQGMNAEIQEAGKDTSAADGLQTASNQITTSYAYLYNLYNSGSLSEADKNVVKAAMDVLYDPSNDPGSQNTAIGNLNGVGNNLTGLMQQLNQLKSVSQKVADSSNMLLVPSGGAMQTMLSSLQNVQANLDYQKEKDGRSGLIEGMSAVNSGVLAIDAGVNGKGGLNEGFAAYAANVGEVNSGLSKLKNKSQKLVRGSGDLAEGSGLIADGSDKLAKGSKKVTKGLNTLKEGTETLDNALSDGAEEIRDNDASDKNLDMFSAPVDTKETQITNVENNGHAMASYMMTVGLWVAALAFCLMYPIARYRRLRSGLSWWASKAVVLYPLAAIMAVALITILRLTLGFEPVEMGATYLVAIVTAFSFMSIMYFFNALIGKAGSFIMLVFMVLQLAGSAGTYPIELSGKLANAIHDFMPFTYSVTAFRSTISGGADVTHEIQLLAILAVIFSILTIILFAYRGYRIKHNKKYLYQWIEAKGMA